MYDAIKRIIVNEEKLNELCAVLSCSKFSIIDLEYLKEFMQIMQPLSLTIDFLQRESNIYFGYLIPSLVTLFTKWRKLSESNTLIHLKNQLKDIETALQERFDKFFVLNESVNDAIVAAVLCPSIKTKWFVHNKYFLTKISLIIIGKNLKLL